MQIVVNIRDCAILIILMVDTMNCCAFHSRVARHDTGLYIRNLVPQFASLILAIVIIVKEIFIDHVEVYALEVH